MVAQNDSINKIELKFDEESNDEGNSSNLYKVNTAFKVIGTGMANGELLISYERRIKKAFSFEIGLGATFPGYFPGVGELFGLVKESESFDLRDLTYGVVKFENKISLTYTLSLKYYISGTFLEGVYLSPEFGHKTYRIKKFKIRDKLESYEESNKYNTYRINIGYNSSVSGSSIFGEDVVYEVYAGLGAAYVSTVRNDIEEVNYQFNSTTYTYNKTYDSYLRFSPYLGIKIGKMF